jgi:hypothetical protein
MDERLAQLEKDIADIKERNRRVEEDKAWERSPLRIASIAIITYVLAVIGMLIIEVPNFYYAALVPATGFVLSTLSLRKIIKGSWPRKR